MVDQQLRFPEVDANQPACPMPIWGMTAGCYGMRGWVAEVQTTLAIDNDRSPEQLRLALKRYLDEPVDNTQDRTLTTFPLDPVIESLIELKVLGQDLKDDR